jgi:hypothetical protein
LKEEITEQRKHGTSFPIAAVGSSQEAALKSRLAAVSQAARNTMVRMPVYVTGDGKALKTNGRNNRAQRSDRYQNVSHTGDFRAGSTYGHGFALSL